MATYLQAAETKLTPCLTNSWTSIWPGTLESYHHHVWVSSCSTCHLTYLELLLKEGLGGRVSWGSSPPSAFSQEPLQVRVKGRWVLHDHPLLPWSLPCLPRWVHGAPQLLISSSESSPKVMHLLNCPGLGDWACLLDDPPWHALPAWGGSILMAAHPGTISCATPQALVAPWMPVQLWLSEWLSLSIFSSCKVVATNAHQWASCMQWPRLLHMIPLLNLCSGHMWCMHPVPIFCLWILLGWCLCRALPWFLLQLGAWPHLCWRCSLRESRISWQILFSISASQGLLLGNLHSWYTCHCTPLLFLL